MINKLIKSLFGLFIVGFGILNFSYGILNIPDCFHYNVYGSEEYRPCQELDIDEDYTLGNSVFHLSDFFDFDNLDGYKYIGGNFHTTSYYYMFWSGSELINISSSTWNGRKYIGSPKFCYYSGTDYFGLFQKCGQHGIGTKGLYYDNYLYSFDNIYDIFNGVNVSRYYINNMNYPNAGGSSTSPVSVCGVYDDIGQSFCIPFLDVSDFSYDGGYIEQHYEYINYTDGGSSSSDVLGYIDYMTNSPLMSSGGGEEGSNDVISIVSSGGSINALCTKDVALQWYEDKGYSSKLCYGGLDDFTINNGSGLGYLPVYGSGLDIEEIRFNTASYRQNGITGNGMGYNEWFGYWRGLYDLHKKGVYSSNPFLGVPYVLLTYFGAVDIYGNLYNNKDILEYCDLDLYTSDYSVVYSGVNVSQICTSSNIYEYLINNPPIINSDINLSGDVDIGKLVERVKNIIHGSGDNSSGDVSSGSNLKTYTDGKTFIKDYVDLLNSEFDKYNTVGGNGILPTYILLALIGLVLFRFMAH